MGQLELSIEREGLVEDEGELRPTCRRRPDFMLTTDI